MKIFSKTLLLAALVVVGCKSDAKKCQAASFEEDIPLCQRVCDTGDALGCDRLGYINMMYRHNAEAKTAYERACKLGNTESCAYVK